jgi:peptidyl-prolyl cis-trans isomerase A (cyclophilin A)
MKKINLASIFGALALSASAFVSQATVVEFRTSLGNIQVNLFDQTTPQTVTNFLNYVNSGAYANNVFHRSPPGFVLQGGGFSYSGPIQPSQGFSLDTVQQDAPVMNEPELSNVVGTIAMAKLGNQPNSATSQWFFNLSDNSASLDRQNGGFTVFGQVIGDGMQVVNAIAALPLANLSGPFTQLPIRDYTQTDFGNDLVITDDNLALITDIVVIDPTEITNPQLTPVPNTLINAPSNPPNSGGGSGGGSMGGILLLLAGLLVFRKDKSAI